jgi:hypothetical protein
VAHVKTISRSFNTNGGRRALGNYDNLLIDTTQSHVCMVDRAIREVTEKASLPPSANCRIGETSHPFYKAQLRRGSGGGIIDDQPDVAWIPTMSEELERGIASYEEYYIAHVRHKILVHDGEPTMGSWQ